MADDDRIVKALEHANYKNTFVQQQKNLKLKFTNDTLYAHNGGLFTVNPTLISYVTVLNRPNAGANIPQQFVLIDDKGVPIKITDMAIFCEEILSLYNEATNAYHVAWETLRKARSVEAMIKHELYKVQNRQQGDIE